MRPCFSNVRIHRFGGLLLSLKDDHAKGDVRYPTTLQAAVDLLQTWERNHPRRHDVESRRNIGDNKHHPSTSTANGSQISGTGVAFYSAKAMARADDTPSGGDTAVSGPGINTAHQERKGKKNSGTANTDVPTTDDNTGDAPCSNRMLHGFEFTTVDHVHSGLIPRTWILFDNQSTVGVFCNKDLLHNIRTCEESMTIYSNSGASTTNLIGDLSNYGVVWFDPQGIANIISMSSAEEKGFRVSCNSDEGPTFHVYSPTTITVRLFTKSPSGLYYSDAATNFTGMTHITTVAANNSLSPHSLEASPVWHCQHPIRSPK
jgi:hypothetical protein